MKIDNKTKQLLKDPVKRRKWIRYQVELQNRSLAQVADEANVSRQCLYKACNQSYPKMQAVIADALGLAPAVLWPERYDADGLPYYRLGRPKKSITKKTDNNSSKRQRNVQSPKSNRHEDAA
jgi:Ner family transcriptional regulator